MFNEFKINAKDFDGPVLVTGASGCIGSWALSLLQEAGVPVFALDLQKDTRRPSLLMSESELRQVKWLVGDISEPATINKNGPGQAPGPLPMQCCQKEGV